MYLSKNESSYRYSSQYSTHIERIEAIKNIYKISIIKHIIENLSSQEHNFFEF